MKHVEDKNINSKWQPQLQKNVATDKNLILRKMDLKFQNNNLIILYKSKLEQAKAVE